MKFYSVFFSEEVEMLDWDFIDCKICQAESTHKWSNVQSGHKFKLCEKCSQEIEKLKAAS